jgi:hypothetical protein
MGKELWRGAFVGVFVLSAAAWAEGSADMSPNDGRSAGFLEAVQEVPRVRSSYPAVSAAIEGAFAGSPTFRRLVATISGTDGIVYVHVGRCGRGVRACLLHRVTRAGTNRILHIAVDPERKGLDLMVSIGHELSHAIELLSDRSIVDDLSARFYFLRSAPGDRLAFETWAAVEAELEVKRELRAWGRADDLLPATR